MDEKLNIFGEPLEECSLKPLTGFFRDGCCNTSEQDVGSHTVCVMVTKEFLEFSKEKGNDLTTPMPQYQFPGLQEGDRWCVCAPRFKEALDHGCAPKVVLEATHIRCLDDIEMDDLIAHAYYAPKE